MPLVVAVFVCKGGAAKSTVSFSLACRAAAGNRRRVLLVSTDPQGDSARWAGGGDRLLRRDDPWETEHGFTVLWSPGRVPDLTQYGVDLVIVDMPPQAEAVTWVRPVLWLVPLDGRNALLDTMPVLPAMRAQGGIIVWWPNRIEVAGLLAERQLLAAAKEIPETFLLKSIPASGSVARVAECYLPPWETPYGKGTEGTVVVEQGCDALLRFLDDAGAKAKAAAHPVRGKGRKAR
jgi:CobQ/CobB/MinD/ParA nucleotide binding domain